MILRAIVRVISAFFKGAARLLAFLLAALGLWVPVLYSLVFLLVCVFTGTRLSTVGPAYFTGLIISFGASVLIAVLRNKYSDYKRASAKKAKNAANAGRVEKRGAKASEFLPPGNADITGIAPAEGPVPRARNRSFSADEGEYSRKDGKAPEEKLCARASANAEDFVESGTIFKGESGSRSAYADSNLPSANQKAGTEEKVRLERKYLSASSEGKPYYEAEPLLRRLKGEGGTEEKPLIFATRKDPDIFIYEYSDRLQFYRRDKRGMTLLSTEYKDEDKNYR